MEYSEFSAKTVNDCITNACTSLGVPSDRLDYEVVFEGSNGFMGIGSKPAIIKARIKEETVEEVKAPELFIPVSKKKQPKAKLNAESQSSEKQDAENLYVEIQGVEKQGQLNTYRSNTKELNTKEIKKEKIKEKPKASKPDKQKKQYAEAVYMTETEYQTLCEKHSKEFADRCIEVLNNYKLSKGKFYRCNRCVWKSIRVCC